MGGRCCVIILAAQLINCATALRGFNLLLRVFETFKVSKVIDLFSLCRFSSRVNRRYVIGLKLHKRRRTACVASSLNGITVMLAFLLRVDDVCGLLLHLLLLLLRL